MQTDYHVYALNQYDIINIKTIRSLLSGKIIDSSPQEIQVQYGETSYIFIYRFGCLVFFNMTHEEIESQLKKIKDALGPGIESPTSETYYVRLGEGASKVEFDYAEIKKLSNDYLRLISKSLGQSGALEYIEQKAEKLLLDTTSFMENLSKKGRLPFFAKHLLKVIGSTTSTRHHILSNLAILDPPDEAWKSKELEKFHKELQQNFDIETRFRTLDRKLTLLQDNIEIIANLANSRRATLFEALIVLLIVMELILVLIK